VPKNFFGTRADYTKQCEVISQIICAHGTYLEQQIIAGGTIVCGVGAGAA
jgi:hypothetical protein